MTISLKETARALGLQVDKDYNDRTHYFCPLHDNTDGDLVISSVKDEGVCNDKEKAGFKKPISLVMHVKNIGKEEALNWLQQEFPDEYNDDRSEEEIKRSQKVKEALEKATELAHSNLKTQETDRLEHIKEKRNFNQELIEDVEIGYLSSSICDALKSRFDKETLLGTGLFGESEEGDLYCHLKERIVFPYKRYNQTWFMIGRRNKEEEAKDQEDRRQTQKYKKAITTDYNDHIVYELKVDSKKDEVIITEGITDAISAYEAGYDVVSPVTIQFSDKDIKKVVNTVKQYNKVYIAMDSDEAGQSGQKTTARQLLKTQTDPYMVEIERKEEDKQEGEKNTDENKETDKIEDLDDYTTEYGYDIEDKLDNAYRYTTELMESIENSNYEEEAEKLQEFSECIVDWRKTKRNAIVKKFHKNYDVNKSDIKDALSEAENKAENQDTYNPTTEQTEQTEQTEVVNAKETPSADTPHQPDITELAQQRSEIKKRLVGEHNNTYFITIWATYEGVEKPMVVTSEGEMNYIKNKLEEKKKQLPEDKELTEEQEKRFDYQYTQVGGEKLKFKHKVAESTPSTVNNVDNRLLQMVLEDKEINKEELFEEVREKIRNYWSHYKEEWFDISTAYAFHTFIAPTLGHTAYIMLDGKEDTGKTTWQKVQARLNYNGWFAGNATPKAVVRYCHNFMVTMHNDEIEKQSEQRQTDLQGLYNTGYQTGAVYPIANADRNEIENQVDEIFSFSPKTLTVNDLYGFDDSFMSRCVILKAVRTNRKDLKDIDSLKDEEIQDFNDLRAKMAYYCLKNHKELKESIEQQSEKIDDTARDEEKMSIFRGLTEHFVGEQRAENVEEAIRDSQNLQDVTKIPPREEKVFEKVTEDFKNTDADLVRIRLSDIADYVNRELGLNSEDSIQTTSKAVKNKLMDYDVVRHDEQVVTDSSGYRCVEIEIKQFIDSLNRYDLISFRDQITGGSQNDKVYPEKHAQSAQSAQFAQSEGREDITKKQFVQLLANASGNSYYKEELKEAGYDIDQLYRYASEIEGIKEDFGIPQGSNKTQNKLVLQKDKQKVLENLEESGETV